MASFSPRLKTILCCWITYDVLLDIAAANSILMKFADAKDEIFNADDYYSLLHQEVLAITTLDNKPVGDGKPGVMSPNYINFIRTTARRDAKDVESSTFRTVSQQLGRCGK